MRDSDLPPVFFSQQANVLVGTVTELISYAHFLTGPFDSRNGSNGNFSEINRKALVSDSLSCFHNRKKCTPRKVLLFLDLRFLSSKSSTGLELILLKCLQIL